MSSGTFFAPVRYPWGCSNRSPARRRAYR